MVVASPLSLAAAEYLRDGEWHPKEELINHVASKVLFGAAAKRAQRRGSKASTDVQIVRGKYETAYKHVNAMLSYERLEESVRDGRLCIRDRFAGLMLLNQASARIGRSYSSMHKWARDPEVIAAVASRCPPGVTPTVEVRGTIWVPEAAIPAWEETARTRVFIRATDFDGVAARIAEVFDLPKDEAERKLYQLREKLREIEYGIFRKQDMKKGQTKKKPPAESDADAPPAERGND